MAPPDLSPSKLKLGVREKLAAALQKKADYARVVFIDVNVQDVHVPGNKPFWADSAFCEIRELEDTMKSAGQETPAAYVIATNHPYQFDAPGGMSAVMEGFN